MLSALSLVLTASLTAATAEPPHALIQIPVPAGFLNQTIAAAQIRNLELDVTSVNAAEGKWEVLVDEEELALLASTGMEYEVVQPDLEAFYASRLDTKSGVSSSLGAWLSPPFGGGSMGGYYTFSDVQSVLDQISAAYPSITTDKFSIGTSVEGRDLWALKVSDNPDADEAEPEVRFDSLHHAREPQSLHTSLWYLLFLVENYGSDDLATYLVDERETFFVPVVNPDGYVYNETTNPGGGGLWRKNRQPNGGGSFGVDLNRNYSFEWGFDDLGSSNNVNSETYRGPSPASEPEVQAMMAFIDSRNFETALSSHSYSNLWLYPWGYDFLAPDNDADYGEISGLATEVNQYVAGPASLVLYLANGVTIDYDHGVHGTHCWTPEIGSSSDGFWPPSNRIVPLAEENLLAFQRTALAAGAFLRADGFTVVDLGDGDGDFELGETIGISVDVRNSGRNANTGSISLTLADLSGSLTLIDDTATIGSVASFSSANNHTDLLAATIATGTPGDDLDFEVTIDAEGLESKQPGKILVGSVRPYLADNLASDVGWTAGQPGDDATAGLWERGDPIGTESSGEPINPEDDASADDSNCFMTGNGGGSAGSDDVDDGQTTLISPRFDLSGSSSARIRYARWFAMASQLDDVFEISISNDDGATWTPLEQVDTPQNQWNVVEHVVGSVIAPTAQMRLRFVASDDPNNSLIEAAVDDLEVVVFDDLAAVNVYGDPEIGSLVDFNVSGEEGEQFLLFVATNTADLEIGSFGGSLLLDPGTMFKLYSGAVPSEGLHSVEIVLPNGGDFDGVTLYLQAVVFSPAGNYFSNRAEMTLTN